MTESAAPLRVLEETPAYWRIIFDYPPFNVADGAMFQALQDLLARMNVDPGLRVVVFESANHDFYLSHFDLTGKLGNVMTAVGPSGLPVLADTFVRITRSPVVNAGRWRRSSSCRRTGRRSAGWPRRRRTAPTWSAG